MAFITKPINSIEVDGTKQLVTKIITSSIVQ